MGNRLAALCLLAMAASAALAERIQVVDSTTRAPLADAWVVTKWEGDFPGIVHSATDCLATWIQKTDRNGVVDLRKWSFKPLSFLASDVRRTIGVYRHGYVAAIVANEMLKPIPPVVEIEGAPDTAGEQLINMSVAVHFTECQGTVESALISLPLLRDIAERAESVQPTTMDEAVTRLRIRYYLDVLDIGAGAAERRFEEERSKLGGFRR